MKIYIHTYIDLYIYMCVTLMSKGLHIYFLSFQFVWSRMLSRSSAKVNLDCL